MATPLKVKDANGNIQEFTTSEENYIAYQVGLHLGSADSAEVGSLNRLTGGTTIGTFSNTFFNEPVGTHPSTSITTGTTNTPIYQTTGTAAETDSDVHSPLMWVDSGGQTGFKQMPDLDLNEAVDRYLSTIFTSEYPGSYRIASSSPGAGWSVQQTGFTDTRTDGTSVTYNIYKKTSGSAPTTVRPMYVEDSAGGSGMKIQAMSDRKIKYSFGQRAKTRINSSGVGTHQLRSATAGAPTDPGTWVARGTATDTKQTTSQQLFTRDSTVNFQANYTRAYTSVYATNYTKLRQINYQSVSQINYTNLYERTFSRLASESFTVPYTKAYTKAYTQNYVRAYTGTYNQVYLGTYTSNYAIQYLKNTEINYTPNYQRNYTGTYNKVYTSNYVRNYTTNFLNYRTLNYTNNYAGTYNKIYTSNYTSNFLRYRTLNYTRGYTGTYNKIYTSNYARGYTRYFISNYVANYSPNYTRVYTANYTGTVVAGFSAGYTRVYTELYENNYVRGYTGFRPNYYAPNFASGYQRDFLIYRTANYVNEFQAPYTRSKQTLTYTGPNLPGGGLGDYGGGFFQLPRADYTRAYNITRYYTRGYIGGFATYYTREFTVSYVVINYMGNFTGPGLQLYSGATYQREATTTSFQGIYSSNTFYVGPLYSGPVGPRQVAYALTVIYVGPSFFYGGSVRANYARDINYLGPQLLNYLGTYTGTGQQGYSRVYAKAYTRTTRTTQYLGPFYSRDFIAIYTYFLSYNLAYEKIQPTNYQGTPYTSNYQTNYSRLTRTTYYVRDYSGADYSKEYTRVFNTAYTGGYVGTYSVIYIRRYERDVFPNYTGASFAAGYVGSAYTRNYQANFVGNFNTAYVRNAFAVDYEGPTFNAPYARLYTGNYQSNYTRNAFAVDYEGPSFATQYARLYTGNYTRNFAADYVRNAFAVDYDGPGFAATYTAPAYVGTYTGNYTQTYQNEFNTPYDIDYTGPAFTSPYTTVYNVEYLNTYIGQYTGIYTSVYTGSYNKIYTGTYTGDYTNDYTGNYENVYTRNFEDTYIQDYLGNFIGNFEGETIDATSETNETYTLYVRIA